MALFFIVETPVIIYGQNPKSLIFVQKYSAAADITESLSEDQVPEAFLVMLLIQFGSMIVDRALYLKKSLMGKCVFQVVLVFGIHFWMFFILPGVTERYLQGYYQLFKNFRNLVSLCRIIIFEQLILPLMCHSPLLLNRRFNRNPVAQLWYFVKCIYFGLSAYQIKCGYPNRILGNFLTKNYNYINLFLFQG